MALINCRECGNQISDEAINCIHCGCLIKKEEKKYCKDCGNELNNNVNMCIHCGCPVNYENEEKGNLQDNYENEIEIARVEFDYDKIDKHTKIFLTLTIVFIILVATFLLAVPCLIFYIVAKGSKNNTIILTNKRIKGSLQFLGETKIDIPLDKIESIGSNIGFFGIETININSGATNSGTSASYILNGEDFCNKTRIEIEKYKSKMYKS